MNKEEIEKKKKMLRDFSEQGQGQRVFFEEDLKLIRDILKELEQKEAILDKVTDKLKQFKTDLKEHEEKYEYKKDISTGLVGVRINAILKIIEGEKK